MGLTKTLLLALMASCLFLSVAAMEVEVETSRNDGEGGEEAAAEGAAPEGAAGGATEAAPPSSGGAPEYSSVGLCEVCMYVVENKQQHQPYLCKGLKDPNYQQICVQTMESLMWWVTNEVYWLNYGCQMTQNGAVQWVRPCPAHAVCSWIQHLYLRKPYCSPDPSFPKPD